MRPLEAVDGVPREPIWRLQQLAGNAAVSSLIGGFVQRQAGAAAVSGAPMPRPAAGPLGDGQVADAVRYYTVQPWRYTAEIVTQLRTALGLDAAGGVDAALVQAVATWQQTEGANDPALTVDGKAGPRTLPRIFRHGLNEPGAGEAFGRSVQSGAIDEWATLATPEARLRRLVELVNVSLGAHGVPAVTEGFDPNPTNDGSFDFPTWRMLVGRTPLAAEQLDAATAREIAQTIYHEARHTEQWYRMAQLRAGQGLSAAGIAAELGIPARIARQARAEPLTPGSMQGLIAQGWWDSVYGAGAEQRNATLEEIDHAAAAVRQARRRFAAHPTSANQAVLDQARARFDRAYAAYRNLPEENDAWATEPAAGAGVTSGTPPAPVEQSGPDTAPGEGGPATLGPDTRLAVEPAVGAGGEAGSEASEGPGDGALLAALVAAGAETDQVAGPPPAAGRPSHEILPEVGES